MTNPSSTREHFEKELAALVARFEKHRADYLRSDYTEAEGRLHFINPLFEALGWDVQDKAGLGRAQCDVIVERGETIGKPDYTFRVSGKTMFYVEAKAPHISLEKSGAALQAKKYAWNTPEPFVYFAAATDFEEFRFYDATAKPDPKHPQIGLIFSYRYNEYLTARALDDLWQLARASVAAGSLDKLLKPSARAARQRAPLDQEFLADLSRWREQFAKAIFREHPDLDDPADLNNVVQIFLDRLIFIRVAEDRGVLDAGRLAKIARAWKEGDHDRAMMAELLLYFREVNDRLNGEIFKRHRCEDLRWDSALVAEIVLEGLAPYNFAQIGVELLGSIYERYLGKTIRVTATRAVVEDKPEVRKAGGVYYTPKYIVDYIVAQTVGKLIEGKSPEQIRKLKILDPACGSGSFLIGAYDALLEYHTRYYAERARRRRGGVSTRQARLLQEPQAEYGEFKLSLAQKAEILRNNIFGVDVDPQAVEITMMSLYIKMLEHGNGAALLPRLNNNIKCGNSLIARDIAATGDERARINPFDWESKGDGFGEIIAAGGFDAVIGNPPYGASLYDAEKEYLNSKYCCQSYQLDSYLVFLEKAIRDLIKRGGFFGMIFPNPWLTNVLQGNIRKFVVANTRVVEIVHFRFPVFPKVTVDTEIVVLQRGDAAGWQSIATIVESLDAFEAWSATGIKHIRHNQDQWRKSDGAVINIFLGAAEKALARKCARLGARLDSLCGINVGIKPYQVGKGKPPQTRQVVEERIYDSNRQASKLHRPYLRGSDIGRYTIAPLEPRYLKYGAWLAEPRPAANFDASEKIVMRQTGDSIVATLDTRQYLCLNNMHVLVPIGDKPSLRYILGVLNSRLMNWYYHTLNPEVGEALAEVKKTNVARFPILVSADQSRHDQLVALVERMLDLHAQKQAVKSDAARERLQREIVVMDEQIDALVYELYGLTKEEIQIVEAERK